MKKCIKTVFAIATVGLLCEFSLHGMKRSNPSMKESSSVPYWKTRLQRLSSPEEKKEITWQTLKQHPLSNLQNIFTLTNAFSEQKQKARHRIAHLTKQQVNRNELQYWPQAEAYSANGSIGLISSGIHSPSYVVDMVTGQTLHTIKHNRSATSVACSADGLIGIIGYPDANVRIIDMEDGKTLGTFNFSTFDPVNRGIYSVACSADGSIALISLVQPCDNDPGVFIIDDGQIRPVMKTGSFCANTVCCADGSIGLIATGSKAYTIDMQTGKIVHTIELDCSARTIACSADGSIGLIGTQTSAYIINIQTGHILHRMKHRYMIRSVACSTDGSIGLTVSGPEEYAHFIDMKTGQLFHSMKDISPTLVTRGNEVIMPIGLGKSISHLCILDLQKVDAIVDSLSLAQYRLLENLAHAAHNTRKAPRGKCFLVSADDTQWHAWENLQNILKQYGAESAIATLRLYIKKESLKTSHSTNVIEN